MNHQIGRIAIELDLFRCHDHDIDGRALAAKVTINGGSQSPAVELARLDDQKIDVAVRSHLAPRRRAEEDDLVRLRGLDDAADDVGQDRLVRVPVLATPSFGRGFHPPLLKKIPTRSLVAGRMESKWSERVFSLFTAPGSAWHPFSQEVGRGMAALEQLEHPISDDTARMFSGMGVPQASPPVVGAGGDDRPHGVNKLSG